MNQYPISIVIPVYKNYDFFYELFKMNRKYFTGCEVIVLNDFPEEDITKQVLEIYPFAKIINNSKNLGFAGNVNKGISQSTREYVFLMNSDVVLRDDSFLLALDQFKKDPLLFAVGFAQKEKDGRIVGSNRGYFKDGLIQHESRTLTDNEPAVNFWAEGGASIFRKKYLNELGMMDELFNPFYWEDIDLSFRAWKKGYRIIFYPKIIVEHHHESTIGKYFNQDKILKTAFRNQLIFLWKNITDQDLLIKHFINIPKFILRPGFFDAVSMLPKIIKNRNKAVKLFNKSDKEILNRFS